MQEFILFCKRQELLASDNCSKEGSKSKTKVEKSRPLKRSCSSREGSKHCALCGECNHAADQCTKVKNQIKKICRNSSMPLKNSASPTVKELMRKSQCKVNVRLTLLVTPAAQIPLIPEKETSSPSHFLIWTSVLMRIMAHDMSVKKLSNCRPNWKKNQAVTRDRLSANAVCQGAIGQQCHQHQENGATVLDNTSSARLWPQQGACVSTCVEDKDCQHQFKNNVDCRGRNIPCQP